MPDALERLSSDVEEMLSAALELTSGDCVVSAAELVAVPALDGSPELVLSLGRESTPDALVTLVDGATPLVACCVELGVSDW